MVWGDKGKVKVCIPTIIDDYNLWMCGVDIINQRIAYYHPNLCHLCNWMPIFLPQLSIITKNAYIVHKANCGKSTKSHKMFTTER
eukprot:4477316-Ditylum_brightwellii.AAC.1